MDICVYELKQPEAIAILENGWRFLTLDDVRLPDHSSDTYYLSGYPDARAIWDGTKLNARMFLVPTRLLLEAPASTKYSDCPLRRGVDFFLDFTKGINELTMEDISNVKMYGTSGCSIWGYRKQGWGDKREFWNPKLALKVMGIQSRALNGDYLRAKSWGAVLRTLDALDDPISTEAKARMREILVKLGYAYPPP